MCASQRREETVTHCRLAASASASNAGATDGDGKSGVFELDDSVAPELEFVNIGRAWCASWYEELCNDGRETPSNIGNGC